MSTDPSTTADLFAQASGYLKVLLKEELSAPKIGIVCGSGLGGLADTLAPEPKQAFDYADIPGFVKSTGM